ncbi:MAG: hypothetical protein CMD68_03230 [Gammaproteobacteria bacterium]|nr:hypothetical protein [Gammaproteobacteria bacterium]|tara:strand:+ start:173 stop:709 length:537 start_codon:yes stop_codon:yes gene_type:complete
MKDFAKKHPINKSKKKRIKTSLRAKRELNQPLKIKHLLIICLISVVLLFASNSILQTDVINIRGSIKNPKVEFQYPIDLTRDTVLIELEGIVSEEDCEYLIQIESYGRRIYAQEQLSSLFSLGLESFIEETFSSKEPDKPLFRVMSGPYLNKSQVNNARELLIKNNREPLIFKKCIKT